MKTPKDDYKILSKYSEAEITKDENLSFLRDRMNKENALNKALSDELASRLKDIENIRAVQYSLRVGNPLTFDQSTFIQSLSQWTAMQYREDFLGIIDYPEQLSK